MAEHAGAVRRREDPRLITGAGEFVDDLRVPGCLHAAMLRSPHAHARIRAIDVAAARRRPGWSGVLRGGGPGAGGRADPDLRAASGAAGAVQDLAAGARSRALRGRGGGGGDRGRPSIAPRTRSTSIRVEYEPLPAVVDVEAALAAGAPILHEEVGSNVVAEWRQRVGDADGRARGPRR